MAILNVNAYATRQTITLTAAEIWQAEGGPVRVMTSAPASETDGVRLADATAISFASGEAVTVWLAGPLTARVVRMAVK